MPTTSITPSTNVSVSASTGKSGLAGIAGTDFMNILVKQLQMQDPFKPMTNSEMVQQLSTIRELELNTRLSGKLEQLTDQQRFGSAAALIGKKVGGTVYDGNGNAYKREGIVVGINFTSNGDVMLELDSGDILPLAGLQKVTNPDGTPVAANSTNTTSNTTTSNTTASTSSTSATAAATSAATAAAGSTTAAASSVAATTSASDSDTDTTSDA